MIFFIQPALGATKERERQFNVLMDAAAGKNIFYSFPALLVKYILYYGGLIG